MSRGALRALVVRDLRLFFADRRALALALAVPIALASIMSLAFGGGGRREMARIRVLVTDEDDGPLSREVVARLGAEAALQVSPSPPAAARESVRQGKASAALLIPAEFGKAAAGALFGAGPRPAVELHRDPSKPAEAAVVRGLVVRHLAEVATSAAFAPATARQTAEAGLQSLERSSLDAADRTALRSILTGVRDYYSRAQGPGSEPARPPLGGSRLPFEVDEREVTAEPGLAFDGRAHAFVGMAVQFVLFMALESGMAILQERRRGLWDRLRAAPLSKGTLLLARALSGALLALLVVGVVLAFGAAVFGVRARGSFVGLTAVVAATALMASSFGLLLGALGRTPEAARGLAILAVLLMTLLGGAWLPTFLFPAWLQRLTLAVPTRWAIDGLQAVTWRGLGLGAALGPAAALVGFALLFGAIAWLRFRWE